MEIRPCMIRLSPGCPASSDFTLSAHYVAANQTSLCQFLECPHCLCALHKLYPLPIRFFSSSFSHSSSFRVGSPNHPS